MDPNFDTEDTPINAEISPEGVMTVYLAFNPEQHEEPPIGHYVKSRADAAAQECKVELPVGVVQAQRDALHCIRVYEGIRDQLAVGHNIFVTGSMLTAHEQIRRLEAAEPPTRPDSRHSDGWLRTAILESFTAETLRWIDFLHREVRRQQRVAKAAEAAKASEQPSIWSRLFGKRNRTVCSNSQVF